MPQPSITTGWELESNINCCAAIVWLTEHGFLVNLDHFDNMIKLAISELLGELRSYLGLYSLDKRQ
jgi:hypothetical protein